MDNTLIIIFTIVVIVAFVAIDHFRSQGNDQRISLCLHSQGASNVVVKHVLLSGDRGNFVYDTAASDLLQIGQRTWPE